MGINSHAFGRVLLTDDDARKFNNQVTYGRPKPAASESVKRGIELSKTFQQAGKVTLSVKPSK